MEPPSQFVTTRGGLTVKELLQLPVRLSWLGFSVSECLQLKDVMDVVTELLDRSPSRPRLLFHELSGKP